MRTDTRFTTHTPTTIRSFDLVPFVPISASHAISIMIFAEAIALDITLDFFEQAMRERAEQLVLSRGMDTIAEHKDRPDQQSQSYRCPPVWAGCQDARSLYGQHMASFLSPAALPAFSALLADVFVRQPAVECTLALPATPGTERWGQITARTTPASMTCNSPNRHGAKW